MNLFELLIALSITGLATGALISLGDDVETEIVPIYQEHYKQFEKFKKA